MHHGSSYQCITTYMINFISLLVLRERIELPPKPCKDPVLPLYEQRLHILHN